MAKQQTAAAATITVPEFSSFMESGGTCHAGPVLAVRPGVPVLALLEHAGYVLTAVDVFSDAISDGAFSETAKMQNAVTGLHYLAQLAHGFVGAAADAMKESQWGAA
ncbi:hypothetical protein [Sinimarinibacterium flocculans]|uniref:hypothetical protein n=1 Tax=Sinimarinibacterium flocculans TaxID=985250 RepID=UPI003510E091